MTCGVSKDWEGRADLCLALGTSMAPGMLYWLYVYLCSMAESDVCASQVFLDVFDGHARGRWNFCRRFNLI